MHAFKILALALQTLIVIPPDSARVVDGRLVVEQLGFSFRIPPLWLGMSDARVNSCEATPAGTIADRILTDRRAFSRLRGPAQGMRGAYAAAVDSVMPFTSLVAHLGGDPWDGTCAAPHMRLYIEDSTAASVASRVVRGVRAVSRMYPPVSHIDSDSAQWHITRLSWSGSYSDYSFAQQTEFWSRRSNGRLITLVFMFIPYVSHQRMILSELRQSVRF